MVTWTRVQLKDRAKDTLHRNYWRMVLVGFIMMLITGGTTTGSGSRINSIRQRYSQSDGQMLDSYEQIQHEFLDIIDDLGISRSVSGGSGTSMVRSSVLMGILVVIFVIIVLAIAFSVFLIQPLVVGGRRFFSRSLVEDAQLQELVCAFSKDYINIVKNMFLMNLFIGLWSLLLVIPGIIKAYEYRMVPYLLGEHPEMSTRELFNTSREMMYGQKWAAFVLDLSFIGWCILGAVTCNLAFIFWVTPYQWLTEAALFRELSGMDRVYYGPQGGGYNQNNPYGQNGGFDTNNPYGQNSGYSQNNPYGSNDGYGQNNPYGQNSGYSQNNPYGQNGGYSQNNPYGQNGGYSQNSPYGQNDTYSQISPYGQEYYSQNPTNDQNNSNTDGQQNNGQDGSDGQ